MKRDINVVRDLAARVAEVAALPVQEEKRRMWRGLNGLAPVRPMVMIDQICWNELRCEELELLCEDGVLREWESRLRRQLYQWKRFPVDSVVEDFFCVEKVIGGLGHGFDLGINVRQEILETDETNGVVSHKYVNQFTCFEDLEKIRMPVVGLDEVETERRAALAGEVFDGLLEVRMDGWDPYLSLWDPIASWMSVEGALYALVDQPDMMLALVKKMVAALMSGLDQMEEMGLLCGPQSLIHCAGAWTDELPQTVPSDDSGKWTTRDIWMFGLAQMFSTVSPDMFDEYEIEVNLPIYERFGLVYYGCCDPLDRKMEQVRRIPNLRKISISPWADRARGAEAIGRDFVFSAKPNPSYLVGFDEDVVRKDLRETIRVCAINGCPLELILKDISTVQYRPERLQRWAEIAMEEVCRL